MATMQSYSAELHQYFGRHRKVRKILSNPTLTYTKDMRWCSIFNGRYLGDNSAEFQFRINTDDMKRIKSDKNPLFSCKDGKFKIELNKLFNWYFAISTSIKVHDLNIKFSIATDNEEVGAKALLEGIIPDNVGYNDGILTLPMIGRNIASDKKREKTIVQDVLVTVLFSDKQMLNPGDSTSTHLIVGKTV